MIGNENTITTLYFLNVGTSKEHIEKAIISLEMKDVVLFSSIQLKEEVLPYIQHLKNMNINVHEIVFINPFTEKSIEEMIRYMLKIIEKYSEKKVEIVTGLTGGTNTMAISFGLTAFIKNLKCNYILNKEENFIVEINTFKKLNPKMTLKEIEEYFRGQ
jgi:CRISPR-associated protein (Cas_Cas02710).